jgi:hypothetical protein
MTASARGPAPAGPLCVAPGRNGRRALGVGPDDLVEERRAAEDAIEQHLAVVDLAVVDVKVQAAGLSEEAMGLAKSRLEEREVVFERVGEARVFGEALGAVTASRESLAIAAALVAHRPHPQALLDLAGVEGWIDVDEIDRRIRKGAQHLEALAVNDPVC